MKKIGKVKCPKCKEIIEYNEELEEVTCNFCGQKINFSETVEDIEKDENYLLALKYLDNDFEYEKAYYLFVELVKKYPNNPKAWFGILRASTLDFEYIKQNSIELIDSYYKKFQETETSETFKNEIEKKYQECQEKSKKSNGLTINQAIFIFVIFFIVLIGALLYFTK